MSDHPSLSAPIILTFDVDWAPEWMIEETIGMLREANCPGTYFATHRSAALSSLAEEHGFEVGLHPNFLPNSSHGTTVDAVFRTLKEFYPEATSCRTHSLMQSEPLLTQMARDHGMEVDCSIHLPQASAVCPHRLVLDDDGTSIVRLPHIFQDNMYALSGADWTVEALRIGRVGWNVFNFHPVHIALNTSSFSQYRAIKALGPVQDLQPSDIRPYRNSGRGAATLLSDLIALATTGATATVRDAVRHWSRSGSMTCAS